MKRAFEGEQAVGKAPRVDPVSGQLIFSASAQRTSSSGGSSTANLIGRLTDPHTLSQRQKQIDYGKNTLAYQRYASEVRRRERSASDPWTPDITDPMSKRRFDGKVKDWRRRLHAWENKNPIEPAAAEVCECSAGDVGSFGQSQPASAVPPSASTAGLTACADNFDDFLDSALEDEEEPLAEEQERQPLPQSQQQQQQNSEPQAAATQPHSKQPAQLKMLSAASSELLTPTWSTTASHPAIPSSEATTEVLDDRSSLRARLDAFKKEQTMAAAVATGVEATTSKGSIFGAFDDGLV